MTDAKNTSPPKLNDSKKSKKTIFGRAIVLLLLCIIGFMIWGFWQYQQAQEQAKKDAVLAVVSRDAVLQKIQSLNRLETIGFNIDTIISTEKEGTWYKLWQDEQKGLFIAHGRVQAGIDLSKLTADNVVTDAEGKTTLVTLPPVEVLNVYLDNIDIYDVQSGLLAKPLENATFTKVQTQGKRDVLKKACQAGILKLANDSAEKQVQALFTLVNTPIQIQKAELPKCG